MTGNSLTLKILVLRIHEILVWIRIRGSIPLINGSGCGSGSCYFRQWPEKKNYLKNFFCLLLFEGTFKRFFTDKKSVKKSLNCRNHCFSHYFFLLDDRRIQIREAQKNGSYGSGFKSGFGSGSATLQDTKLKIANENFVSGESCAINKKLRQTFKSFLQ